MWNRIKILSLIIALASASTAYCQKSESIGMHTDRNKYISGEVLWFSLFNIKGEAGRLTPDNVIVYVDLINPWNMPVIQKRYRMADGRSSGSFHLNDTLSSGTYLLRAYTNPMKAFLPDDCFITELDIFNPFKGSSYLRRINPEGPFRNGIPLIKKSDKEDISIDYKRTAGKREKISVKISPGVDSRQVDDIKDLCISVTAEGFSDSLFVFSNGDVAAEDQNIPEAERNGHFLSLKRADEGYNILSQNRLFMSVQGKTAEFRYAEADSTGVYTFVLPPDSRERTYILQPEVPDKKMRLVTVPSFPGIIPVSDYRRDTLGSEEKKIFSDLSFNYQASGIYGAENLKTEEEKDPAGTLIRRFYGKPEMEIHPDDYIRLPDMSEVFFELLPGIILRQGKTGYEIKITNPLTGVFYEEPPLIMIDGVIINELDIVAGLDPDMVERIEVVMTPYLIGNMILHGIVNIITRTGDFSKVNIPDYTAILKYRVVEPDTYFISPDYTNERDRSSRIPDLRNTIYWNPSVRTDLRGEAEVEFWTSDIPGNYTISVRGLTESGKKICISESLRVR